MTRLNDRAQQHGVLGAVVADLTANVRREEGRIPDFHREVLTSLHLFKVLGGRLFVPNRVQPETPKSARYLLVGSIATMPIIGIFSALVVGNLSLVSLMITGVLITLLVILLADEGLRGQVRSLTPTRRSMFASREDRRTPGRLQASPSWGMGTGLAEVVAAHVVTDGRDPSGLRGDLAAFRPLFPTSDVRGYAPGSVSSSSWWASEVSKS